MVNSGTHAAAGGDFAGGSREEGGLPQERMPQLTLEKGETGREFGVKGEVLQAVGARVEAQK